MCNKNREVKTVFNLETELICMNWKGDFLMFDQIHEECGVFGVYSPESTTSYCRRHLYGTLCSSVQRSAELWYCCQRWWYHQILPWSGSCTDTFNQRVLSDLGSGRMAVGHVLHGASNPERADAQPLVVRHIKGSMALAFNGALVNALELKEELELKGAIFHSNSDAEIISHVIINERLHTNYWGSNRKSNGQAQRSLFDGCYVPNKNWWQSETHRVSDHLQWVKWAARLFLLRKAVHSTASVQSLYEMFVRAKSLLLTEAVFVASKATVDRRAVCVYLNMYTLLVRIRWSKAKAFIWQERCRCIPCTGTSGRGRYRYRFSGLRSGCSARLCRRIRYSIRNRLYQEPLYWPYLHPADSEGKRTCSSHQT